MDQGRPATDDTKSGKPKSLLRRAFNYAMGKKAPWWVKSIRSLGLAGATILAVDAAVLPNLPGRPLTPGETKMVDDVFHGSVDASKIRIHHSSLINKFLGLMDETGLTRGNVIMLESSPDDADYSRPNADFYMKFAFLHEAAHVWQEKNGVMPNIVIVMADNIYRLTPGSDHLQNYRYTLVAGKDLTKFNIEQQADIIADFNLYAKNGNEGLFGDNKFKNAEERKAAFEDTLKNFIANPAYPRGK